MPAPHNQFKTALKNGEIIIGCWLSLGDPLATEIAGTAGFDWLLIDGEHTPYDISRIRMQLIARAYVWMNARVSALHTRTSLIITVTVTKTHTHTHLPPDQF